MGYETKRYKRMFEGYEKRQVIDAAGNLKTEYVYTGDYYQPKMSKKAYIARKLIFAGLFVAALAINIIVGIQDIEFHKLRYCQMAQAVNYLALFFAAISIVIYISHPFKMKIREFRSSHKIFKVILLLSWIASAIAFAAMLLVLLTLAENVNFVLIGCIILYGISAMCLFICWYLERNTCYDYISPEY